MEPATLRGAADAIDRIITAEMRIQGFPLGLIPTFYAAARGEGEPLVLQAARALRDTLKPGETALVLCGAGQPVFLPRGESDGPPGAAELARVLSRAYRVRSVIAVEEEYAGPVEACVAAAGSRRSSGGAKPEPSWPPTILGLKREEWNQEGYWDRILDEARPAVVISIEKLGPNSRGVVHSVMGIDCGRFHYPGHELFERAKARGALSIGIGDGGNELGFGNIAGVVQAVHPSGRTCRCPCGSGIATVVSSDVLVVANISNWGALGVGAAVALLEGDPSLLPTADEQEALLRAGVDAGMRDGIWAAPIPWVDGVSIESQRAVATLLREVVSLALTEYTRPY